MPKPELVETSDLSEGVVLAAVRVAGQIRELAQLAEDGHRDLGIGAALSSSMVRIVRSRNNWRRRAAGEDGAIL